MKKGFLLYFGIVFLLISSLVLFFILNYSNMTSREKSLNYLNKVANSCLDNVQEIIQNEFNKSIITNINGKCGIFDVNVTFEYFITNCNFSNCYQITTKENNKSALAYITINNDSLHIKKTKIISFISYVQQNNTNSSFDFLNDIANNLTSEEEQYIADAFYNSINWDGFEFIYTDNSLMVFKTDNPSMYNVYILPNILLMDDNNNYYYIGGRAFFTFGDNVYETMDTVVNKINTFLDCIREGNPYSYCKILVFWQN